MENEKQDGKRGFSAAIKNKGGRPRKKIADMTPEEQVFHFAKLGCTQEEIAKILKIDRDTLRNRKELYEQWEAGISNLKIGLRKLMLNTASSKMPGYVAMQIWLSKQYLGMKDKIKTSENKPKIDISARVRELDKHDRELEDDPLNG